MRSRSGWWVGTMVGVGLCSGTFALEAQSPAPSEWKMPRTPDGQPDLQGIWSYKTITPLERPSSLAGKQVLSDQEAAEFEVVENRRQNRDLIDPTKGGAQYPAASAGGVVPYNEFWYDRGEKVVGTRRTSMVVDPPDGRVPPYIPQAQQRAAERAAANPREDQAGRPKADSHEDRPLAERCIMIGTPVPMLPYAYNNNVRIVQTAGHVVIMNEMIHDSRVIPLDGRPHAPQEVRQLLGDSRGRWDGDTLVVETTNFTDKSGFRGSTAGMTLVERFNRVAPDAISYEFTVTDSATWARPWTAVSQLTELDEEIYEYACHEGNTGLLGVLGGARFGERSAAKTSSR